MSHQSRTSKAQKYSVCPRINHAGVYIACAGVIPLQNRNGFISKACLTNCQASLTKGEVRMTRTRDRKHRVVEVGGNRLAKVRRSGQSITGRSSRRVPKKSVRRDNPEKEENGINGDSDILTIGDEKTQKVLSSISSETALDILKSVHENPKLPKDLAKELDMTVQNVRYHLNNLEEADLVEVGDIRYSEKGREMSVYEPSESPSVLVFGKGENEVQDVLRSVHETPRTPKEISDEVGIPVHRVKHHLQKLETSDPSLVEARKIHRRATVWSATKAGIDHLSDGIEKRDRVDS